MASSSSSCSVDDSCCDIPPLWAKDAYRVDNLQLSSLDQQIRHFYHQIQPTQHDKLSRTVAFRRVQTLVQGLWPHCELSPFGSYATGLYLPSADIDASIVFAGGRHPTAAGGAVQLLQRLVHHLRRLRDDYTGVDFRSAAKVPIVRFTGSASAIRFDISVRSLQQEISATPSSSCRELQGVQLVRSAIAEYPTTFAPLYLLLKAYLQHHRFDEIYRSGGVNSFMLFVMLKSFLDLHTERCGLCRRKETAGGGHGLGFLLLAFFHFYGASLEIDKCGVTCRKDRPAPLVSLSHLSLSRDGVTPPRARYGEVYLGIEDPLGAAPGRNIGRSAFNFGAIRQHFYRSYNSIVTNIDAAAFPPLHPHILPDAASFRPQTKP